MTNKRWRRIYRPGRRCQDCGHCQSTTIIYFWLNKMAYVVCGKCINAYRGVILTNHAEHI